MDKIELEVPPAWEEIVEADVSGVVLVVGAPDVGKSTFARYLYQKLLARGLRVGYLDGDPGQSFLGPPTTMTILLSTNIGDSFPSKAHCWRSFVGAVSPRGHMLQTVVGSARLIQVAQENGVMVVVYDTSGLVDPVQGGLALKQAKVDMLQPSTIVAVQHNTELEPLLVPLRRSGRVRVIDLRPAASIRRRGVEIRQANRASHFARYFANAKELEMDWMLLAVIPAPTFAINRLVAFEDINGFTIDLGIVSYIDRQRRIVKVITPLETLGDVDIVRIGDVFLDPETFRDRSM